MEVRGKVSPAVARMRITTSSTPPWVGMVGLLALLAEGPDETLGEDAEESIGEI